MFTQKASSKQKWVKRTQEHENRGCCHCASYNDGMHRTTMECAEKILFATGKIVVRFPSIVLRWNVDSSTGTDQFSLQKTQFHQPKPQI